MKVVAKKGKLQQTDKYRYLGRMSPADWERETTEVKSTTATGE